VYCTFRRRRQVDGVAELDFDFARRQLLGADHVVAHLVAAQQVAEILLVQAASALGQVAHAGAARQVAVVVDFFLGSSQRHVRKAARGARPRCSRGARSSRSRSSGRRANRASPAPARSTRR
jgi:hypothetical protein